MIDSAATEPAEAVAAEQGDHRAGPGRFGFGGSDSADPGARRGSAASFRELTAKLKARPTPLPAPPAPVTAPVDEAPVAPAVVAAPVQPEPTPEPVEAFEPAPSPGAEVPKFAAPAEEPESTPEMAEASGPVEPEQPAPPIAEAEAGPIDTADAPYLSDGTTGFHVEDPYVVPAEPDEPEPATAADAPTFEGLGIEDPYLPTQAPAAEAPATEAEAKPAPSAAALEDDTDTLLRTFADTAKEAESREVPLSLLDTDFAQLMNAFLAGDDEQRTESAEAPEASIEAAILEPIQQPVAEQAPTEAEAEQAPRPHAPETDTSAHEPSDREPETVPEAELPMPDLGQEPPAPRPMPLAFDLPRLDDFEDDIAENPEQPVAEAEDMEPSLHDEPIEAAIEPLEEVAVETEEPESPALDPVAAEPEAFREPSVPEPPETPEEEALEAATSDAGEHESLGNESPFEEVEAQERAVQESGPIAAFEDEAPIEDLTDIAGKAEVPAADEEFQVIETAAEALPEEEETAPPAAFDSAPEPTAEEIEPATEAIQSAPESLPDPAMPEEAEEPVTAIAIDPRSAETARMLLDIMSMPSGASQPQERALAADTLLRLVDRMPEAALANLAERLSIMDVPPQLLVKRLIVHPNADIAGPLLENCNAITDRDLIEIAGGGELARLKMIARRRHISSALADALIRRDDTALSLTLIRNQSAVLSHDAFRELAERAKTHPSLQAPLATRADTPTPVAFELFWFLPMELRRYVLSRFLTDSSTLERILRLARSVEAGAQPLEGGKADPAELARLVELIGSGGTAEAAGLMASLAHICEACAERVISDPEGEPLTVVLKALGLKRKAFAETIEDWRSSPDVALSPNRDVEDLKALFDTLSFNKARVLLTYWDWASRRSGPYARQAA